jgi:hypothetical protein
MATPAAAANPVLDPEDDAELVEALAEATAVHDVCYGYVLEVTDNDTGVFEGTYVVTNAGVGAQPSPATCSRGQVLLFAYLTYASELSESEDSAGWQVSSSLGGPTTGDLEQQGLSAGDLTDDGKASAALRNGVLVRQSTGLIVLCVLVLLAGLAVFASSFRAVRQAASAAGAAMKEAAE